MWLVHPRTLSSGRESLLFLVVTWSHTMLKMDRLEDQPFCLSVHGADDSRTLVHDDSRYASHIRVHASHLTSHPSTKTDSKETQISSSPPTSEFCGFMIVNPTYSAATSLYSKSRLVSYQSTVLKIHDSYDIRLCALETDDLRLLALLVIVSRHDHPYPRHHPVFHRVFC